MSCLEVPKVCPEEVGAFSNCYLNISSITLPAEHKRSYFPELEILSTSTLRICRIILRLRIELTKRDIVID